MNLLSEPVVLMILPACLVFLGMFIGFALWSWSRGIDSRALEDLHDDIRRLGNRVKENSDTSGMLDLQFENDELRAQCKTLATTSQDSDLQMAELQSVLQVRDSEVAMAENTIEQLKVQLQSLESEKAELRTELQGTLEPTAEEVESATTYQFVSKPVFKPQLMVSEDPSQLDDYVNESVQATEPIESTEPTILRPSFAFGANQAAESNQHESRTATNVDLDIEYGGEVRFDSELGLVYSRPPMFNDNLQLISGIASKLEQQLNDYGVYTFQQIMLWNSKNIDAFSNLLDTFQDRIERDDWVGQAQTFYYKAKSMRRAA